MRQRPCLAFWKTRKFAASVKILYVAAALVLLCLGSLSASDFHVPGTISPEAQMFLQALSLETRNAAQVPAAGDMAGWHTFRMQIEQQALPRNERVTLEYALDIRSTTIGGVPVLDIRPAGWQDTHKAIVYVHGGAYTLFSPNQRSHFPCR